jgi:ribose transport system substrate-binding protein
MRFRKTTAAAVVAVALSLGMAFSSAAGLALAAPKKGAPGYSLSSTKLFPKHGLVIAYSNGYTGNTWLAQSQTDVAQAALPYEKAGIVSRVIIENANNNVSTQISQIQNLINIGVNAIVVNPISPSALTPVLERAAAKGIVVIGSVGGLLAPHAVNVQYDQVAWTRISALWVFQHMHGQGNLLVVNGLAGQSTNTIRYDTVLSLLKQFPKIHLLQQVNGNWVEADAQQAVSSVLSSYPKIDGVWTQDGGAIGAIQAFEAANRKLPVIATDDNVQFLRLWAQLRKKNGFQSIAVFNPPGISADGFLVAVRLLEGWKIKPSAWRPNQLDPKQHNAIYIEPTLVVTDKNLDAVLRQYQNTPATYYLDGWLTANQINPYFNGF